MHSCRRCCTRKRLPRARPNGCGGQSCLCPLGASSSKKLSIIASRAIGIAASAERPSMLDSTLATEHCIPPRGDMADELIRFINEVLPEIHAGLTQQPHVDRHTCLFESGLI